MICYLDDKSKKIYDNREDFLNESLVFKGNDKKKKYCIYSDPQRGRNFETNIYIKVYDSFDQNSAKNLIRISMKTGKEVPNEHANTGIDAGKGYLKYTKSVANFLQNAMNKPYQGNHSNVPDNVKTVYDMIYHEAETTCDGRCIKYPIPNFEEGIK